MPTSLTDVAGVCNFALARKGYKLRVGSLFDGTSHAKKLLDVYAQTRDALLRAQDWNFAQKIVTASASGTAPLPWLYQWAYPSDALMIRQAYSQPADPNNPVPSRWSVGNSGSAEVVWTVFSPTTLIYTAKITDPSQWEPLFLDALASLLGRNLHSLMDKDDPNIIKLTDEEINQEVSGASARIG